MIYKSSTDGNTPTTPTNSSYDFLTNSLSSLDGWSTSSDSLSGIIYMSSGTFTSNADPTEVEWSTPVRITGVDGQAGKDGADIDFAYCLTNVSELSQTPSKNDLYYDNEHFNYQSKMESGVVGIFNIGILYLALWNLLIVELFSNNFK